MEFKWNSLLFCGIKWDETTGMNLRTKPYIYSLADACQYISDFSGQFAM